MKHRPWKCRETIDDIHYIFQILSVAVVVSLLNEVFAQSSKSALQLDAKAATAGKVQSRMIQWQQHFIT